MHKLKMIKECLEDSVIEELSHLDCCDAAELGEVIDMIKDLEQAMYYHSMVEKTEHEVEAMLMGTGAGTGISTKAKEAQAPAQTHQ
jgi:hypothetical protein